MDNLSTLWQGASYQDNLLQGYRHLHLVLQSIFLATGAGLVVGIILSSDIFQAKMIYGVLFVTSILGLYMIQKMSQLIKTRAEDVNYFHNQIIDHEKKLPKADQVLTAFKVFQKFSRHSENPSHHFYDFELDDTIRKQLIEKGKGHTRKILDQQLNIGFYFLWITYHAVSILSIMKN